jgi:prepilin-type processing-associated H-X9-DG protein
MYPARVHGGGANVLFGDGHVNCYLQKNMLDLYRSTESGPNPESVAMWRRWNVTFRS